MKKFMEKDFLLTTETAKTLYHEYAKKLPIIDYHCHVNPQEIAEDKRYSNITELWLGGDHYKWRAIRTCGVDEELITGNASDYDKFKAYASIMPKLIGNPLYHWSHLELRRYFGYKGVLNSDTCDEVWELCNAKLADKSMSVRNIIKNSGVEALCTTDDPIDDLRWHKQLMEDKTFNVRILPAFRPDKGINCERKGYSEYITKLSKASGIEITDLDSLKSAYIQRLDYFDSLGCLTADHGMDDYVPFKMSEYPGESAEIFARALKNDEEFPAKEADAFKTEMHRFFAAEYNKRGWVMQVHYGVLRNSNSKLFKKLGPDVGCDIISGINGAYNLAKLIDSFANEDSLPKMVLYSVNPTENASLAALSASFQNNDGTGLPRIEHGSAWWFNDNKTGMFEQMTQLANLTPLGNFLGMLTDSRSFISYTRHEYFRRIFCELIGNWVENGEYPCDLEALTRLVMDVCYNNTKNFFGF